MRSVLEPYYEPQFSQHSHGFRPGRGCHTALIEVQRTWTGVKWIIEGDISSCFDTIDHTVLLQILEEKLHDKRFIRLIKGLLEAGYIEDWKYNKTYSGTPQGGVISPLLANIYLDKLDRHAEEAVKAFDRGKKRASNLEYGRTQRLKAQAERTGNVELARDLMWQMRRLPAGDPNDPSYRRLKYIRYADDFMIGVIGPKSEAEEIKRDIGRFLQDSLHLKLSEEKTLITNASQDSARFLGYEVKSQHSNEKIAKKQVVSGQGSPKDRRTIRSINGTIALLMPRSVIQKKSTKYLRKGRPIHLSYLQATSDFAIVTEYQAALRGLYQYYALATNVSRLNDLKWLMEQSLMKTLAGKHNTSKRAMYVKYATKVLTEEGKSLRCIQVTVDRDGKKPLVARFGGFSLVRKRIWEMNDQLPIPFTHLETRTEILQRLLADRCEICGSTDMVEVHHVRKLADVTGPKNGRTLWKKYMASRNRKTLVVCMKCHDAIHAGRPLPALEN
jgi:group II intron reverse transcriptase/maturase